MELMLFGSLEPRSYDAFVNRSTGEKVEGGTSYWLTLFADACSAPLTVKVPRALGEELDGCFEVGDRVNVDLNYVAGKNGAFYARVQSVTGYSSAPAAAVL